jgi:type VI secretion system secreted protein Hcp
MEPFMSGAVRTLIRKLSIAVLVVTALGVGYVAHGAGGPSSDHASKAPAAAKKFTASDLLRVASTEAVGPNSFPNSTIHMRFTGITAGTPNVNHSTDIPVSSFQFGVGRGISDSPHTAAKPSVSEITLTHTMDAYSTKLLNSALRGTATATSPVVTLFFTATGTSGPYDYLQITLTNVLVSQYSVSSGGENPTESISLNFVKITMTSHIPQGSTQTVSYDASLP